MAVTVGLIAEDIRFVEFLVPAMRMLAGATPIEIVRTEKTGGCRARRLTHLFGELRGRCRILVVAGDAKREGRPLTCRQKNVGLRRFLGNDPAVVPAAAAPSVEAWLLCDGRAFAEGIRAGTGEPFRMPDEWPIPRSEAEGKEALGRVVSHGCGGPLPRSGFEYAPEIVARMDLLNAPNNALAEWARVFSGAMARAATA
jgi:hypothetical protein